MTPKDQEKTSAIHNKSQSAEGNASQSSNQVSNVTGGTVGGVIATSGVLAVAWGMSQQGEINPQIAKAAQDESSPKQSPEAEQVNQSQCSESDPVFESTQKTTNHYSNDAPISAATSVRDDMSFSEAFAAARQEVGSGGVFIWRGNLYGTYYKEEWENMTSEQKAEYNQAISQYAAQHLPNTSEPSTPEEEPLENRTQEEVYAALHQANYASAKEERIVLARADFNEDGVIDAVLIDTNNDGEPDRIAIDSNYDGIVDAVAVDHDYDNIADAIYLDFNQDGTPDLVTDTNNIIDPEMDITQTMDNSDDFDNDADVSEWM